jgi:hypothetical protein
MKLRAPGEGQVPFGDQRNSYRFATLGLDRLAVQPERHRVLDRPKARHGLPG